MTTTEGFTTVFTCTPPPEGARWTVKTCTWNADQTERTVTELELLSAGTDSQGRELLWREDVARLTGVSERSIRVMASTSRAKAGRGELAKTDLPVPVDTARRTIKVDSDRFRQRTVESPRWRRDQIEAYLTHRRRPGNPGRGVL